MITTILPRGETIYIDILDNDEFKNLCFVKQV